MNNNNNENKSNSKENNRVKIDVPGFSTLAKDMKKSNVILLSGGCGTGKTTFALQSFYNAALNGEKCIFITLEEPEESIKENCKQFGWDVDKLEKQKKFLVKYVDPLEVSREVEAAMMKKKGELLVETKGVLAMIPKGFKPDRVCIDSVSTLYSAFIGQEENYRAYFTKLIDDLRKTGALVMLVSEMEQELEMYSRSGLEEFVADGVIVFYNVRKGSSRQRALEVLKLRGTPHLNRIVPFDLTSRGIDIRSEERIFE